MGRTWPRGPGEGGVAGRAQRVPRRRLCDRRWNHSAPRGHNAGHSGADAAAAGPALGGRTVPTGPGVPSPAAQASACSPPPPALFCAGGETLFRLRTTHWRGLNDVPRRLCPCPTRCLGVGPFSEAGSLQV